MAAYRLSLVVASGVYSPITVQWLLMVVLLFLQSMGSRTRGFLVAHGLSSGVSRDLEHSFSSCGV